MKIDKKYKANLVFVAIVLLILSIFHIMPYGFYQLTRLIVFGFAAYFCYEQYSSNKNVKVWVVAFAIVALVFNPIIKIYFPLHVWHWVDFLIAGVFLGYWCRCNKKLLLSETESTINR